MKINKYKKVGNNKYLIELDKKEIKINEEVILKNNLLFRKEIDDKELDKILDDNDYYNLYNKCVKYISIRIRSEYEINKYLENIDFEVKKNIINKLKGNNLINDETFVKCYIDDKLLMSTYGPNKLREELLKNNIDITIIDKYIDSIEDNIFDEKIDKIINKYMKNNKKYTNQILKNKIYTYLINGGYNKNMFMDKLDNIKVDNSDLINKDYNKLYKKYSKKYSDYELNNKIKIALYNKGYTGEDINKISNFS